MTSKEGGREREGGRIEGEVRSEGERVRSEE